ncbi:YuzF family protein [Thalassobacillus hwangdonensis]|uniref:YuzF family protein n=1 Tax=Thalassobacillus hwangdonensis TaxID=546108 RepID=A0ABW3L0S6_9BACI
MYYRQQPEAMSISPQYITVVDPFVVSTLQSVIGKTLIVETVRDTIRGDLEDVKPDHIVLTAGDSTFFVRIQQIVTIMPDLD